MLTAMRKPATFLLFLLAISVTPFLQSCYKEPGEGTARVLVIDENQLRVPYASVTLSQGSILMTGITDYNGVAEFKNKLEVILNVEAQKGAKEGEGIARIKPGQTITEVITIY